MSVTWHDPCTGGTWLIHMCDMTHSRVWHDLFTCVTWLIHVCEDSFTCVTWLIHMCDMTHSHVWHDSFTCVTWHRSFHRIYAWWDSVSLCIAVWWHILMTHSVWWHCLSHTPCLSHTHCLSHTPCQVSHRQCLMTVWWDRGYDSSHGALSLDLLSWLSWTPGLFSRLPTSNRPLGLLFQKKSLCLLTKEEESSFFCLLTKEDCSSFVKTQRLRQKKKSLHNSKPESLSLDKRRTVFKRKEEQKNSRGSSVQKNLESLFFCSEEPPRACSSFVFWQKKKSLLLSKDKDKRRRGSRGFFWREEARLNSWEGVVSL